MRPAHELRRVPPRRAIALGVLLAGLLSGAPIASAASSGDLRLTEGGGAVFPARSLVLSVPGRRALPAARVHVSENGRDVGGAVVRPIARAGAGDFGIVLAIDVSPSMRGAPLERAMSAARALAAQRTGKQELAIVTFDRRATVVLGMTDDANAIAGALARTPQVGRGAYIYNALTVSVGELQRAKIASGAVILLSDGASEGSRPTAGHGVTARDIGAAAAAAHAQIYTVGLRDSSYTPQRMSLLARVGGGVFAESSSAQLAHVFTRIEAGLTSGYVLHYRSSAPAGERVQVSVAVDGIPGAATLAYQTPPAPRPPRLHPVPDDSFWASTLALALFTGVAALLIGLAIAVFLLPRLRRGHLRRRVGQFTTPALGPVQDEDRDPRLLAALERALEKTTWWPRFKRDVEIARIEREPGELLAMTALATIVTAGLLGLASGTPVLAILVLLAGPMLLRALVHQRLKKQRDLFAEQLPTHLQELASAMRAGHSLVSGISSMAAEAPEPSGSEWSRVVADEQLGVALDEAMVPMQQRMDCEDIGQVALVAALHRRTGGNMAEVLERVADSVRERAELRRELNALTAQARLSRYVVTALPPVVAGAVALLNPSYLHPLFHTSTGVFLVFLAAGLLVAASLIMKSIAEIEV